MLRFFPGVADRIPAETMAGVPDAAEELWRHGVEARLLPSPPDSFPMWLIDATRFRPETLEGVLSEMERERAGRFRVETLRNRYIAAHGSLRILLRHCYGVALEDQDLQLNEFGKPRLARFPHLHYSISYSANYVLLGLNEGGEIGVDIEVLRSISDADDLAEMHYTAKERAEIWDGCRSGTDLSRAFLNVWVRKEACVKAVGQGLGIPLNEVECSGEYRTMTVFLSQGQYKTGLVQIGGDPIMAWARSIQTYASVEGPVSKPC